MTGPAHWSGGTGCPTTLVYQTAKNPSTPDSEIPSVWMGGSRLRVPWSRSWIRWAMGSHKCSSTLRCMELQNLRFSILLPSYKKEKIPEIPTMNGSVDRIRQGGSRTWHWVQQMVGSPWSSPPGTWSTLVIDQDPARWMVLIYDQVGPWVPQNPNRPLSPLFFNWIGDQNRGISKEVSV